GFQVADPVTSRRRGAFAYAEVRDARKAEERAERLRLYYVAMTRAIDRLIVSGAIDDERRGETPIGWVLSRLDADEELERAADGGLAATAIGDAAHRLLEQVDLAAPVAPDVDQVRTWYPAVSDEELERVRTLVEAYCSSELAARLATLPGATKERHFTFEHDDVLVHGYLDVFHLAGGRALVADYKTNVLGEATPADVVETEYRLQRLVYALACLRA